MLQSAAVETRARSAGRPAAAFVHDALLLGVHAVVEPRPLSLAIEAWIKSLLPCRGITVGLTPTPFQPLYAYHTIHRCGRDPHLEARYNPRLNPALGFIITHPGRKFVFDSDLYASEEAVRHSAFYREVMALEGWDHGMAMAFWRGRELRGVVSVFRPAGEPDFSSQEGELLRSLYPHLHTAIERVLRFLTGAESRRNVSELLARLPQPALILDWDLRVRHSNRSGMEQAAVWNYGPHRAARLNAHKVLRVPGEVVSHCHDMKRKLIAGPDADPDSDATVGTALIHHPTQAGLAVTVTLLDQCANAARLPCFLVEFRERTVDSQGVIEPDRPIEEILTRREFHVAQLVCAGLSNAEISERLGSSLGTVKKQVSSVLAKLDLQRRSQLVRLLR